MGRLLAISDMHGYNITFNKLLKQIKITREDHLVLVGDYVDKGNDSKGVMDTIIELQAEGYQVTVIRGNHDHVMVEALQSGIETTFMKYGGQSTIDSFPQWTPDEKYLAFLKDTLFYYETENYIFAHAGVNVLEENIFSDKKALLSIRGYYNDLAENKDKLAGKILVHGHTPQTSEETKRQVSNLEELPVICIDNGCFLNPSEAQHLGKGKMCCADLTDRNNIQLYFEERDINDEW